MKVTCNYGFIKFYPQQPDDLVRFKRIMGVDLVSERDYFTFEALKDLPRHSVAGMPYAGITAIKTYEGRDASEVLRENKFVYNLEFEAVVPILAVIAVTDLNQTLNYAVASGPFLQPGARVSGTADRILSYSGWLSLDYQRFYLFDREFA